MTSSNNSQKRLAIGTAQFGMPYGISNKYGQIPGSEVSQILDYAFRHQINTLDTAMAYGNSEEVIGQFNQSRFHIITKLPHLESRLNIPEVIRKMVKDSLKKLQVDNLYSVLLHDPTQLLTESGTQIYNSLKNLQSEGLINKWGISIYDPDLLNHLYEKKIQVDLVQAPFNILDRRIISSGWAKTLFNDGVEIHARSIFLQGLLLTPQENIESKKFKQWRNLWNEYIFWLKQNKITPVQACLEVALSEKYFSKIIVGCDGITQLQEITETCTSLKHNLSASPMSEDLKLINPSNWQYL